MVGQAGMTFTLKVVQRQDKRSPEERTGDFESGHNPFKLLEAAEQAGRCAACQTNPCQGGCPLGNRIREWLDEVAKIRISQRELETYGLKSDDVDAIFKDVDVGSDVKTLAHNKMMAMLLLAEKMSPENAKEFFRVKLGRAIELAFLTNPFPEGTGRVCPQKEGLCEAECTLARSQHGPVVIGGVEEFIGYIARKYDLFPAIASRKQDVNMHVGIIGTGPAAIGAAYFLRRAGYQVTMYEAEDKPGGLLMYGIPNDKLPKEIVEATFRWFKREGIKVVTSADVGKNVPMSDLIAAHDIIVMAPGAQQQKKMNVPGEELVRDSSELLKAGILWAYSGIKPDENDPKGSLNAAGKVVGIFGGGDTAKDDARTAKRMQGVEGNPGKVIVFYRRSTEDMPGSIAEVTKIQEEGAEIREHVAATSFERLDNGKIRVYLAATNQIDKGDGSMKRVVVTEDTSYVDLDMALNAYGYDVENLEAELGIQGFKINPKTQGLAVRSLNNVSSVKNIRYGVVGYFNEAVTRIPGKIILAYSGGDGTRGANLVVKGLSDGQKLAQDIITKQEEIDATSPEVLVGAMNRLGIPELGLRATIA